MSYDLKYRPQELSEVIGNGAVIKSIKKLLSTGKGVPHSWMLYGNSGVGKTTVARIMAKEMGATPLGILEKNGADHRKIDDVRQLLPYLDTPIIGSKSLVVILDECHQLTKEAQNALLKSLEEPPENVYFILCTTDPKKIINTIRTRVKMFAFAELRHTEMSVLVRQVYMAESLNVSEECLDLIITAAGGSARLGLNLLEKCQHITTNTNAVKKLIKSYDPEMVDNEAFDVARKIYQILYQRMATNSSLTVTAAWSRITSVIKTYIYDKNVNMHDVRQGLANLLGSFLQKKFSIKVSDAILLLSKEVYTKAEFKAVLCKAVGKIFK